MENVTTTFKMLRDLHAVLGVSPCSWDDYRTEMIFTYGIQPAVLDTLYRLGYLQSGARGVSFYGN